MEAVAGGVCGRAWRGASMHTFRSMQQPRVVMHTIRSMQPRAMMQGPGPWGVRGRVGRHHHTKHATHGRAMSALHRVLVMVAGPQRVPSVARVRDAVRFLARLGLRQSEVHTSDRLRRALQLYSMYCRMWGEEAARVLLSNLRRTVLARGRHMLLSAVCFSHFNWETEQIPDESLERALGDLDNVMELVRATVQCEACGKRQVIDYQMGNVTYCRCGGSVGYAGAGRQYDSWEPFIERENHIVWRQRHPVHQHLYAYKVYGVYDDVSLAAFLEVQLNSGFRTEWDDSALDLHVLDSHPQSNSDLVYWLVKFPQFFANRDYVFKRRFSYDGERGEAVIMSQAINSSADFPENKGIYRVHEYWSTMVVRAKEHSNKPGIEYTLTYFDNPGTSLPKSITNFIAATAFPNFLVKVHRAALSLQMSHEQGRDVYVNLPEKLRFPQKFVHERPEFIPEAPQEALEAGVEVAPGMDITTVSSEGQVEAVFTEASATESPAPELEVMGLEQQVVEGTSALPENKIVSLSIETESAPLVKQEPKSLSSNMEPKPTEPQMESLTTGEDELSSLDNKLELSDIVKEDSREVECTKLSNDDQEDTNNLSTKLVSTAPNTVQFNEREIEDKSTHEAPMAILDEIIPTQTVEEESHMIISNKKEVECGNTVDSISKELENAEELQRNNTTKLDSIEPTSPKKVNGRNSDTTFELRRKVVVDILEAIEVVAPDMDKKTMLSRKVEEIAATTIERFENNTALKEKLMRLKMKLKSFHEKAFEKKMSSMRKMEELESRGHYDHSNVDEKTMLVLQNLFYAVNDVLEQDKNMRTGKGYFKVNEEKEIIKQENYEEKENNMPPEDQKTDQESPVNAGDVATPKDKLKSGEPLESNDELKEVKRDDSETKTENIEVTTENTELKHKESNDKKTPQTSKPPKPPDDPPTSAPQAEGAEEEARPEAFSNLGEATMENSSWFSWVPSPTIPFWSPVQASDNTDEGSKDNVTDVNNETNGTNICRVEEESGSSSLLAQAWYVVGLGWVFPDKRSMVEDPPLEVKYVAEEDRHKGGEDKGNKDEHSQDESDAWYWYPMTGVYRAYAWAFSARQQENV